MRLGALRYERTLNTQTGDWVDARGLEVLTQWRSEYGWNSL